MHWGKSRFWPIFQRLNVWDRGGGGSGHRVLGRDVEPRWYRVEDEARLAVGTREAVP